MKKLCIVFNKNWEPTKMLLCVNDIWYLHLQVVAWRFKVFGFQKNRIVAFDADRHFYEFDGILRLYNPNV